MSTTIKLLLLFLGFDIFIYGVFTLNIIFIVLGLVNTLFLLSFVGYNFGFIKDIIKNIKNTDLSSIKMKNRFNGRFSFNKELGEFYVVLKDINKHYIFIISLLVFIFILFSRIIGYQVIDLNIYASLIILLISVFIGYKDILTGELYLFGKKIRLIDYILFLSIILFYIFFNINGKLELYERFFISSLFSTIFFIFSIKFLGIREIKYGRYKASYYIITILVLSIIYFLYGFLNIKNMYNDFYEGKTKVNVINQVEWEKVFITPDDKEYSIVKDNNIYVLKSFKGQDYNFDNLSAAQDYILGFYKEETYMEEVSDKLEEISKNLEEAKVMTGSMTDKEMIPYLLKDKYFDNLYNPEIILPNISSEIDNYKFYNIAYNIGLITIDSDLSDPVYCMNYIAMKGIVEKWNISNYNTLAFFDAYYNTALDLGEVPEECIEDKNQLFKWEFLNEKVEVIQETETIDENLDQNLDN